MKKLKKWWPVGVIALVALAAVGWLPSLNLVYVSGPDGTVNVQHAGFGGVRVKTQNADIRANTLAP